MNIVRVVFEETDEAVDVQLASPERVEFARAIIKYLRPLILTSELGRLSEETALRALAEVYAVAVIVGSPTPALEHHTPQQWQEWLLANPDRFLWLRSIAEDPAHFGEEETIN